MSGLLAINTHARRDSSTLRAEIDRFGRREMAPQEAIAWAVERFPGRLILACSFQKESSVLIDMLCEVDPKPRVVTADTHLLFPETYEAWHALEQRYGLEFERHQGPSLVRQTMRHGRALWERDPSKCCDIRKVQPLRRALETADAWMSGVRRDQAPTRAKARQVGWDEKHGLVKLNPLVRWTDADVWQYIAERDLPYNRLHDRGYGSIGCITCTQPGEGRSGRWVGFDKVECGIHA